MTVVCYLLIIRFSTGTSYITNRPVALVSDTIMSRDYLERLQSGKPEEALLGISMYPPEEARIVRQNNIEEIRRLLELTNAGGIIILGTMIQ